MSRCRHLASRLSHFIVTHREEAYDGHQYSGKQVWEKNNSGVLTPLRPENKHADLEHASDGASPDPVPETVAIFS